MFEVDVKNVMEERRGGMEGRRRRGPARVWGSDIFYSFLKKVHNLCANNTNKLI